MRTRDRIHSMALVHDRLCYYGTAAEIDFSEYVESLGRELMISFGADRRRIQLHTSVNARLGLTDAIPIGLILNELLTKSLKHAFPNGQPGNIWLSRSEENGEADLQFTDDGAGLPPGFDCANSKSLGMQLISDLTTQPHGTLTREPDPGTRFHFHFRLRPNPRRKPKSKRISRSAKMEKWRRPPQD